jgi:hypothetical protein
MPLGFLILGAIVLVTALRNTHKQLGTMLAADFSGTGSFIYWIAALAIVGGLGYVPSFQAPSRALIVLLLVVLLLSNRGFFTQFSSALSTAQPLAPTATGGVVLASATQSIVPGTPGAGGIDAPPAGEPSAPSGFPVVIVGGGGGSSASSAAGAVGGIAKAASSLGGLFGL